MSAAHSDRDEARAEVKRLRAELAEARDQIEENVEVMQAILERLGHELQQADRIKQAAREVLRIADRDTVPFNRLRTLLNEGTEG